MNPFQQYHQRYIEIKDGIAGELTDESFSNFILLEKTLKLTPLRRSKLTPLRRSKLTPLKKC